MQESLFVPLNVSTQVHVQHLQGSTNGPVVFMLHGAIENGRIFYSERARKGLGWFLAAQGMDVYIADLGGRGLSFPPIHRHSEHGQTESIVHEIPAILNWLQQRRPQASQIWISHSWGGVLQASVLARFPQYLKPLKALVYFGSKRSVQGFNREKLLKIHFFWNRLAFVLTHLYGYLPARELKLGADAESRKSHGQSAQWIRGPWLDPEDGFDYAQAIQSLSLPPQLYLAGQHDFALGHPEDVERFRQEVGGPSEYWFLGRQAGFQHDYGHIDMLTHKDAPEDIFKPVLHWLQHQLTAIPKQNAVESQAESSL